MLEVVLFTMLVASFTMMAVLFFSSMVVPFSFVVSSWTLIVSTIMLVEIPSTFVSSWPWMASLLSFHMLMRKFTSFMAMCCVFKFVVRWRSLSDNFLSVLVPSIVIVMTCHVELRHKRDEDNNIHQ